MAAGKNRISNMINSSQLNFFIPIYFQSTTTMPKSKSLYISQDFPFQLTMRRYSSLTASGAENIRPFPFLAWLSSHRRVESRLQPAASSQCAQQEPIPPLFSPHSQGRNFMFTIVFQVGMALYSPPYCQHLHPRYSRVMTRIALCILMP